MSVEFAWVDAFADRPGTGNPAAVVLAPQDAPEAWMQALAREFGLSETAFARELGPAHWALRWFTPAVEVSLCGHATVATAWYLGQAGHVPPGTTIAFETRSGTLHARVGDAGVTLDFPAQQVDPCEAPDGLASALGAEPLGAWRAGEDLLVLLDTPDAVARLAPDMAALAALPHRGIIVTAAGGSGADFVSRFFGPAVGVDEDPATGSAHCALGPFWAGRLGRRELRGRQLSQRGGILDLELHGDRILIRGGAVTVARGILDDAAVRW